MTMRIGEGFAGSGANAAHINTVLGSKDGPVGTAWATALATPRLGHAPFVVVAQPDVPVKPCTLFVNKAAIEGDAHARLTWGAAQAGVAAGVIGALRKGVVAEVEADSLLLIAGGWVNPGAGDEDAVYDNNADGTLAALSAGRDGTPSIADILAAVEPHN